MEKAMQENARTACATGKASNNLAMVPGYKGHGKTTSFPEMPPFTMLSTSGRIRELFAEQPEKAVE